MFENFAHDLQNVFAWSMDYGLLILASMIIIFKRADKNSKLLLLSIAYPVLAFIYYSVPGFKTYPFYFFIRGVYYILFALAVSELARNEISKSQKKLYWIIPGIFFAALGILYQQIPFNLSYYLPRLFIFGGTSLYLIQSIRRKSIFLPTLCSLSVALMLSDMVKILFKGQVDIFWMRSYVDPGIFFVSYLLLIGALAVNEIKEWRKQLSDIQELKENAQKANMQKAEVRKKTLVQVCKVKKPQLNIRSTKQEDE